MRIRAILAQMLRSFAVVPAAIAAACVVLAFVLNALDAHVSGNGSALVRWLPSPSIETTRTILAAVATATITVVSLVYSLTLVVFTLAAGSIAPRLIERFVTNRAGQVTSGLFTGAFFYCLVILIGIHGGTVPQLSLLGAVILMAFAVAALIYFTRSVSEQITVDSEISRITKTIGAELAALDPGDAQTPSDSEPPELKDATELAAWRTGYVATIDLAKICGAAQKADAVVDVKVAPGDFLVKGLPIACVASQGHGRVVEELEAAIVEAIQLGDLRTPDGDPAFSIHLLVEIALRALSPGVNDSYTAMACIDHLAAAFAEVLGRGVPSPLIRDEAGAVRVVAREFSLESVFVGAWHALRRGAAGNVVATIALVRALGRIAPLLDAAAKKTVRRQLSLIEEDARAMSANRDDIAEVVGLCVAARRELDGSPAAPGHLSPVA